MAYSASPHRAAALIAGLLAGFLVAGCNHQPLTVEEAMRKCVGRALQSTSPTQTIGLGVRSDGTFGAGFSVSATQDYLAGRSPAEAYELCVFERTGYPPTKSLAEILDERAG